MCGLVARGGAARGVVGAARGGVQRRGRVGAASSVLLGTRPQRAELLYDKQLLVKKLAPNKIRLNEVHSLYASEASLSGFGPLCAAGAGRPGCSSGLLSGQRGWLRDAGATH